MNRHHCRITIIAFISCNSARCLLRTFVLMTRANVCPVQVCARARDALLRMKRYEAEHATEELIAAMAGEDVKVLFAASMSDADALQS